MADSNQHSHPKKDAETRILWLELELIRFEQIAREHGLRGLAEQMRMALGTQWKDRPGV